jgi:hypothetical protein
LALRVLGTQLPGLIADFGGLDRQFRASADPGRRIGAIVACRPLRRIATSRLLRPCWCHLQRDGDVGHVDLVASRRTQEERGHALPI